ncbi:hypothetical protein GA0115254_101012 [Streptomyces sp. Ncost-T10-10d]|nr:hypothetical protein GA0115254_101012 [Streptomyces sp. Ncost-T10-10d]
MSGTVLAPGIVHLTVVSDLTGTQVVVPGRRCVGCRRRNSHTVLPEPCPRTVRGGASTSGSSVRADHGIHHHNTSEWRLQRSRCLGSGAGRYPPPAAPVAG